MILTMTLATLVVVSKPVVDSNRFLASIQQVEGTPWSSPGGALGLSQATWRQHSHLPYRYASIPAYSIEVAEKHLAWLVRSLKADSYEASVYQLALCWRYGFEGGKLLFKNPTPGYGTRAANLYFSPQKLSL